LQGTKNLERVFPPRRVLHEQSSKKNEMCFWVHQRHKFSKA